MKNYTYSEMKLQPTGRLIKIELFTLEELSNEARERAYKEWLDEYCESFEYICELQYSDVITYGEKALASVGINAEWDSWDNCYPGNYADPHSGRFSPCVTAADYLPDDAGAICHMDDFGFYSSMDMADTFNEYETELRELVSAYAIEWDYEKQLEISAQFARVHNDACRAACRVFQNCYEEEKEYNESMERFEDESMQGYEYRTTDNAGRVHYSDNRRWYTADGELYEQSNISHECVSIVKAS